MAYKPLLHVTHDQMNRTRYWLSATHNGPKIPVQRLWATVQLKNKMIQEAK